MKYSHRLLFSVMRNKAKESAGHLTWRVLLGKWTHWPCQRDSALESPEGIQHGSLGAVEGSSDHCPP